MAAEGHDEIVTEIDEGDLSARSEIFDTRGDGKSKGLETNISPDTFESEGQYHRINRADAKQNWCKLIMEGKLHLAPLDNASARILDLGTGSGIWCVEMGDAYPSTSIIGTDFCQVKPSRVPPNVRFEIADFEDEWAFGNDVFDFIHIRFNTIAVLNYSRLFARAFEALRPGGHIEVVDLANSPHSNDNTLSEARQVDKFFELMMDGCKQVGRDPDAPLQWRAQIEEAGLVDIEEQLIKVPVGSWPKEERWKAVGNFQMEMLRERLSAEGVGIFTRVLKWRLREVEAFLTQVRRELDDTSIHLWLPLYVVWAQKR